MNKAILIGRLTREPELRYTQSGIAIATFTLAIDRPKQKEKEPVTDFIDVTAWRGQAENVANYLGKGRLVAVEGRIQTSNYTDKSGNKRKSVNISAETVKFLDYKKDNSGAGEGKFVDDDIPF